MSRSFQVDKTSSPSTIAGDGFTSDELVTVPEPTSAQWIPTEDYEDLDIGSLQPGPRFITFVGRIANIFDSVKTSKSQRAARGCLILMVADDTGAVTVRLWYASMQYNVRLGQLVTIYAIAISSGESSSLAPSSAPLYASIFPERERNCHIMLHTHSDNDQICKHPFNYKPSRPLLNLMTLKTFISGGHEIPSAKLILCVKIIHARKTFTTKHGTPSTLLNILVFDDTAEATLTLYGTSSTSLSTWKPSSTILLLTNPGYVPSSSPTTTKLTLASNTRLDIDPSIPDATYLRTFAHRLTTREAVNPPFPDSTILSAEQASSSTLQILYTLSDIDAWVRTNPTERFTGWLSLIITNVNIVINRKRNMLMCAECEICGVPVYANAVRAECRQCGGKQVHLRINPKILGDVIDETGRVESGKLVFSEQAWAELLGRTAEQFVSMDAEAVEYLEERMRFLRVSVGFGWCGGSVGRLCVWGVRM